MVEERKNINDLTTAEKWALLGQKHEQAITIDREINVLRQLLSQEQQPPEEHIEE